MRRRRRETIESRLYAQQSKIYFNLESQLQQQCAICFRRTQHLVKPCHCSTGYHERCLLIYIQRRVIQQLRQRQQMDLSTLRCLSCNHRFYILATHQIYRSCSTFCDRLSKDCCNGYIIFLSFLLIIIIATAALAVFFMTDKNTNLSTAAKYGLISALVFQGLLFLAVIYGFLQKYMTVKKLLLEKVYEMIDLRSMSSENSDENKVSQDQVVVIKK